MESSEVKTILKPLTQQTWNYTR